MKLSIAAYALVIANACTVEDYVGDINIAGCLDGCATDVEMCIGHVAEHIVGCEPGDQDCLVMGLLELSDCVTDMAHCASDCTAELEESLS